MVLKIAVIGNKHETREITEFISKELYVEVTELTQELTPSYSNRTANEIRDLARNLIEPIVGLVHLIILADPALTLITKDYLHMLFPEQKIVGYGKGLREILDNSGKVMILTSNAVKQSLNYQLIKRDYFDNVLMIEPNCQRWITVANITKGIIPDGAVKEIVKDFKYGTVIIYSAAFLKLKSQIEKLYGWKVTVVDLKDALLYEVCKALKIKGYSAYKRIGK